MTALNGHCARVLYNVRFRSLHVNVNLSSLQYLTYIISLLLGRPGHLLQEAPSFRERCFESLAVKIVLFSRSYRHTV